MLHDVVVVLNDLGLVSQFGGLGSGGVGHRLEVGVRMAGRDDHDQIRRESGGGHSEDE
ncbi:hypothetical protein SDC9_199495 [bioreactor metagenome]|uniref:Uncharacterized protein n=1 Tax=bioreactor metagenome TaxID=1076179 RepID=A0A645IKK9_9ZZZZ